MCTKFKKDKIIKAAKVITDNFKVNRNNESEEIEAILICRDSSLYAFMNEEECKELCCSKDDKVYLNDKKSIFVKDKRFDLFNLGKYWHERIGIIVWKDGNIESIDDTKTVYDISEKEIINAKSIEDFYNICNNDNQFHPDEIDYFVTMLNNITKKDSLKKAKEFLAFLEAGGFSGSCPGHQFTNFSLPSRREVRISDRNTYELDSMATYYYDGYEEIEKVFINVVFDGTKWYIKSTRVGFEVYYDKNLQKRTVKYF